MVILPMRSCPECSREGPNGPPLGLCGPGPNRPPWPLMGQALVGPPGPLRARPLWARLGPRNQKISIRLGVNDRWPPLVNQRSLKTPKEPPGRSLRPSEVCKSCVS